MLGADIERMMSGINSVKEAAESAIISFSSTIAYQITSEAQHAGYGYGTCNPTEKDVSGGDPMSAVTSAMSSMSSDVSKMSSLESSNYTDSTSFNNSIGSPWTELKKLQSDVDAATSYASSHSPFNYVGEKAGMLAMLNMVMSAAVDAKWAIQIYHDYVQRGYDCNYNDKTPSVTYTTGINKKSIGNLDDDYSENVNLPQESIDPF